MTVLLLRLAGPMQSWGVDSRFTVRETQRYPSKSGVLGLLAAAMGRRRTDPVEDLLHLSFGVRVDQPGRLMSDFHTAHDWRTGTSMPLSTRYYLSDAVFVAAVAGDHSLLSTLDERLADPVFPLYLGRRSCPITGRVSLGLSELPLEQALRRADWQAASWYQKQAEREVRLPLHLDAPDDAEHTDSVRDVPLSFNPERRQYGWRRVVHPDPVVMANPKGRERRDVDWFAAVAGGA